MKLIVAGSRGVEASDFIHRYLDSIHKHFKIEAIVSGMAKGPDSDGKDWAEKNNVQVIACPADWDKNGSAAGPIRNQEMAKVGTALIAFWDGESPGTKNMIKTMEKLKKPTSVIIMPKKVDEAKEPLGDMFDE